jgi:hypothetical protein
MADVIHCSLDELDQVLLDDADRHVEEVRAQLTEGLTYIQEEVVAQAPRLEGDFAASVRPYAGEPKATWRRGGGGGDAGAAEVESAMEGWRPGEEVGVGTDAPYSRKLIFHAGDKTGQVYRSTRRRRGIRKGQRRKTYTKRVGAGWVDNIVADANRLMGTE